MTEKAQPACARSSKYRNTCRGIHPTSTNNAKIQWWGGATNLAGDVGGAQRWKAGVGKEFPQREVDVLELGVKQPVALGGLKGKGQEASP